MTFSRSPRVAILLAFSAVVATSAFWRPVSGGSRRADFVVAPVPTWVSPVEVPTLPDGETNARDGVLDLLADTQVRVTARAVERYYHRVAMALTAAGLEQVSQVQFDFDPSEEALHIHYVHIRRGGEVLDALRPGDVSVIQPERELDDRIFNGELSAITFLRDVRPGDVVDVAYSLVSSEGFGGRFADEYPLGDAFPIRKVHWRLLWPLNRPVWLRALQTDVQPTREAKSDATEYTWERDDAPAVDVEDDAPLWYDPTPTIQVSEFETWADVVRWALPYYTPPAKLSSSLQRRIERWSADSEKPEDRLLAAARFVQDEIRYTGIELGPSSFQPADPSTVFERRFGDCKDKSLLLVTILRAMGIDASPALVNLDRGRAVADWQPSPLAFDHCIARATVEGKTYWIDATILLQRGDLSQRRNPPYESALVVDGHSSELSSIAGEGGGATATTVHEVYTLDGEGAQLESTTTYTGTDADDARYSLARSSLADVTRDSLDAYGADFSDVEADGQPVVEDDEAADRLRITEKFRIATFWEDGSRTLTASSVEDRLASTRSTRRTGPLAIEFPVDVTQIVEVNAASPISVREESDAVEDDAMRYEYRFAAAGERTMRLEFRYRTLRDSVPATRAGVHRDALKKVRKHTAYTIRRDDLGSRRAFHAAIVGGPLVGIGVLGAAVVLFLRRRRASVLAVEEP